MRIYRVEDKEHFGPYRTFDVSSEKATLAHELVNAHRWPFHHPTPFDEKLCFWPGDHICGFDETWKLRYWFDGFFEKLLKVGFELSIYAVPSENVLVGEFQVVFPIDSRPIQTLSLNSVMHSM